MRMIDGMLAELEQEGETTRRVLERIPQAHLSWKPHAKSMSLGQLALHVATIPGSVAELAALDTIPEPPAFVQREAATAAELVPSLDRQHREGQEGARRIRRLEDDGHVAVAERWQRHPGNATSGAGARNHAEPLVSPPWPAARLPATAQPVRAFCVRPHGGRESVCDGGARCVCLTIGRAPVLPAPPDSVVPSSSRSRLSPISSVDIVGASRLRCAPIQGTVTWGVSNEQGL